MYCIVVISQLSAGPDTVVAAAVVIGVVDTAAVVIGMVVGAAVVIGVVVVVVVGKAIFN